MGEAFKKTVHYSDDGVSLVEAADYAAMRGLIDLEPGVDVQAYSARLAEIAALGVTDGSIIVGNGLGWVLESGATARTSLGFTDPILNKTAPGNIGAITPGTGKFTSVTVASDVAGLILDSGGTTTIISNGTTVTVNKNVTVNRLNIDAVTAYVDTNTSGIYFVDTVAGTLQLSDLVRVTLLSSNLAVQLNGTNQYASYTGTAFDPGVGDFSNGCAFCCDTVKASMIFASGTGSQWWTLGISSTGKLEAQINDGDGVGTVITGDTTLLPGLWYTAVFVADRDGNGTLYLNGVADKVGSLAGKTSSIAPGNLYFGRFWNSSFYFSGRIDNAFYANRVVTDAEIAYLHNAKKWRNWAELGVAGTDGANLTSSVILGFWGWDSSASLGTDSTTNANHFTVSGFPTQAIGIGWSYIFDLANGKLGADLDCNGYTIHFGTAENEATIATGTNPNTCTVNLSAENHWTIPANDANNPINATITMPPGPCGGTIFVENGATPRDITWLPAESVLWLGTEPDLADASEANEFHGISWRFNGTYLFLSDAGKTSITP